MAISTVTHNWSKCRRQETEEFLAVGGRSAFYLLSSPLFRGHCRKVSEHKECKIQRRWPTMRKHYLLDTTEHLHTWTHSAFKSMHKTWWDLISVWREELAHNPTPSHEATDSWQLGEGRLFFSVPGKSTVLQWNSTIQEHFGSTNWSWRFKKEKKKDAKFGG